MVGDKMTVAGKVWGNTELVEANGRFGIPSY